MMKYTELFRTAPDAMQAIMLQDMNRGIDKLHQEKNNITAIQDSSEMSDRYMHDKGSNRLFTGDERVEKKLIKNDREIQ